MALIALCFFIGYFLEHCIVSCSSHSPTGCTDSIKVPFKFDNLIIQHEAKKKKKNARGNLSPRSAVHVHSFQECFHDPVVRDIGHVRSTVV